MKKIFTKKQLLNEMAVEYDPQHPERMNPNIERALSTGSHTLGNNPALPPTSGGQSFQEKIASQRFKDVVNKVKRYSGEERLGQGIIIKTMNALKTVLEIEKEHKEELNNLAKKLVKKEFGLKDEIDLIPDMGQTPNLGGMQIDEPEDEYESENVEDMENVESEIKKRRLINSLIQGASKKGHYMFHLIEDELNRIDPRLINLYGLIMSVGDYQYWMVDDETIRQMIEQAKIGKVTAGVTDDKNDPREDSEKPETKKHYVHGQGLIFPVVVHELIKGVMEILSLPSLPKNPKIKEYVLSKTDFLMGENWDLRLGPGLWEKFLEAIDENAWDIKNHLYQKIVQMPTSEFNSFMKELLAGTQKGKRDLAKLAGEIKQDIIADKYEESEYEKKKSERDLKDSEKKKREEERKRREEEESKKAQDDFLNSMQNILNNRNNMNENKFRKK